ncbi:hypothetical protein K458DRAFT_392085 [Lentithecium fluviatile CBS 122367]|uniref:Uncharacterized protein n=1 Tax=Lentithecium fluviatile CBS 122367 TaxID=1168545 RepID=A0A6G1IST3_9PLEO|nr:hypothetical protein K458DRAFT_392085 [Lentithecium fluviatile CBS 122367]
MGWLWSGDSSAKDKLDPSLRDFLEKEAPIGPKPTLPKPAAKPVERLQPAQTQPQTQTPEKPAVPPQSQFQDGRYAHLWKGYTPQQELESRGKTEQDKLRDIVDAYNDRKARMGEAALENCAFEYLAQFDCFRQPNARQLATLCHSESRTFNKCYDAQKKVLQALGWMDASTWNPEASERMQMHADKLYQQKLEQQRLIDEAKEKGLPEPQFESVLSKQNMARVASGGQLTPMPRAASSEPDEEELNVWRHIKPESRQKYEKKLSELPPEEREFERKALLGELRAQTGMAKQVEQTFIEERINRMKRREEGQATIGDTIKRWWGWD